MRYVTTILAVSAMLALAGPARADWDPGDGHKMHYPQLPDPNGWDVAWSTNMADDWMCSSTGPVDDIHLWFSWLDDVELEPDIGCVSILIHSDDRSGPFSKPAPGSEWCQAFVPGQFTIRPYGTGDQGWYDPMQGVVLPNNHQGIYQLNITNIINPFVQKAGTIYWLDVYVQNAAGGPMPIGWKTSLDHFEDDAVYWEGAEWMELRDPFTNESLDLAFVITPEPGTLALLGIGGLGVLLRRRRRK